MSARINLLAAVLLGAALQAPASAVERVPPEVTPAAPVCAPSRSTAPIVSTTTPEDVARVVEDFVRAYNEGDNERAGNLFSPEPDFEWYSVSRGHREEFTAYDRSRLPSYFARRHHLGDRLRLLDLDVSEQRGWHGGYDFAFRLVRLSDQHEASGRYHGKGAGDCTIFVWSMGRRG